MITAMGDVMRRAYESAKEGTVWDKYLVLRSMLNIYCENFIRNCQNKFVLLNIHCEN